MVTCKDCVHYELCEDWFKQIKEEGFITGERSQQQCESFKNKADFVEVRKAAEILNKAFGNDYPCNFNNIDEWLPYLCEYANTCDCSSVKCWEQLIKHYGERRCDNDS